MLEDEEQSGESNRHGSARLASGKTRNVATAAVAAALADWQARAGAEGNNRRKAKRFSIARTPTRVRATSRSDAMRCDARVVLLLLVWCRVEWRGVAWRGVGWGAAAEVELLG